MKEMCVTALASPDSYHTEDNCSGTLYVLPVHALPDSIETCWQSNRCLREGDFISDVHKLNPLIKMYTCSCGQFFLAEIKDSFGT